ncbi:MAG: hypothetical protein NC548_29415 [Lachnospiraceae bacterium]|nr:hypothetical protein [Lachnospiraceae bacterium]
MREKSSIILYLDENAVPEEDYYVDSNFSYLLDRSVLNTEFATYCIEKIDGNKHVKGADIISPWLGSIPLMSCPEV